MYLIRKIQHVNEKPGYEGIATITSFCEPDNDIFSSYYMAENNMGRMAKNDLNTEFSDKHDYTIAELYNDKCDIAIVDSNKNIINEYSVMELVRVDKNSKKEM